MTMGKSKDIQISYVGTRLVYCAIRRTNVTHILVDLVY